MGPGVIVVAAPGFGDPVGIGEAMEQVLVEAFVPKPPVEALDEGVLHRLARLDVVPLDAVILRPFQDGVRGELRPLAIGLEPMAPQWLDR